MDIQELRLELLRLTYIHGRETSEAVVRARILEEYVQEEVQETVPVPQKRVGRSPKAREPDSGP